MLGRSALSQDLSELFAESEGFIGGSVEVQMHFQISFPVLGGSTGRIKYTLVSHHNECHLRDEVALYIKRYGVTSKFLMKVGSDLMDDITYNRSISAAYRNKSVLHISVVPVGQTSSPLTAANLKENQREVPLEGTRRVGLIDLSKSLHRDPYKKEPQNLSQLIKRTSAPSISNLSGSTRCLSSTSSGNSLCDSNSHIRQQPTKRPPYERSVKVNAVRPLQVSTHSEKMSHKKHKPREDTSRNEPENSEILRRHDVRNLRNEHEESLHNQKHKQQEKVQRSLCALCNIDIEDDESLNKWLARYKVLCSRSAQKESTSSLDEWRRLLRHRLGDVAKTYFVDKSSGHALFVHLGCAEISWEWQLGEDMSTVVENAMSTKCELCREFGASCVCSQPNCDMAYHTSCALFSPGEYPNGLVSFGLKPHLRRCPKCPLHREQSMRALEKVITKREIEMLDIDKSADEAYRNAKRRLT